MKIIKHFFAIICLMLIVTHSTSVYARTSPGIEIAAEVDLLLAIAINQELSPLERKNRLRQILEARFDFNDMSRRILAVNWRSTSEQQKIDFIRLLKDILELTYISALASYTSERINIGGERVQADRATIMITITKTDGTDIPLLFKMKWQNNKWLAYDANINYLSMVNNYREQYGKIIKNQGMDGLLTHMKNELNKS